MVAAVSSGELNSREADFVREYLGTNPPNASLAYRRAYHYTGKNSDFLAVKIMRRPAVKMAIAEAIEQTRADGVLEMRERRRLLADTARRKIREAPSHAERINAIREDAILAGERRPDGSQIAVGVSVTLGDVLAGLGSSLVVATDAPVSAAERPPESSDAPVARTTLPECDPASSPSPMLFDASGAALAPAVSILDRLSDSPHAPPAGAWTDDD